jgi:hypothetical protein
MIPVNAIGRSPLCSLPCPSWCESSHDRSKFGGSSHQVHHEFSGGEGQVTLYMQDWGPDNSALADFNGQLYIHVIWKDSDAGVIRPLEWAGPFAEMAEAFGRPDAAALIRELAAIAESRMPA